MNNSSSTVSNKPIKYVNLQNQKVPENIIRIIMKTDGLLEKQINAFFKPPEDMASSSSNANSTVPTTPSFSMADQIKAAKLAKQQRDLQPVINNSSNNNNLNSVQTTFSDNVNSAKTIESVKTGLLLSPVTMAMVEKVKAKPATASPVLPSSEKTKQKQTPSSSSSSSSPLLPSSAPSSTQVVGSNNPVKSSNIINKVNINKSHKAKEDEFDDDDKDDDNNDAEWEDGENPVIIAFRKREAEKKKLEKLRNGKTATSNSSVPMIPLPKSTATTTPAASTIPKPTPKYKLKLQSAAAPPQSKLVQAQVQQALLLSHSSTQQPVKSSSLAVASVSPTLSPSSLTASVSSAPPSKPIPIQSSTSSSASSLTAATSNTTALMASTLSKSSSRNSIESDEDFLKNSYSAAMTTTTVKAQQPNTKNVSTIAPQNKTATGAKSVNTKTITAAAAVRNNKVDDDDDSDVDNNDTFDMDTKPYIHPLIPTSSKFIAADTSITPIATTTNTPAVSDSSAVSNVLKAFSPRISCSSSSSTSYIKNTSSNSTSNKSHAHRSHPRRSRNNSNRSTDDPAPWKKNDDDSSSDQSSSLKSRNAEYFAGLREMRIQEQREKEERESSMDEIELAMLRKQEKEQLKHNSQKNSHYAQLGLAFAKSPLSSLMSHTYSYGGGGGSGRGSNNSSCQVSPRDSNKSTNSFRYSPRNTMSARVSGNVLGRTSMFQRASSKQFETTSGSNKSITDTTVATSDESDNTSIATSDNHTDASHNSNHHNRPGVHMMKKMISPDHFGTHHNQQQPQEQEQFSDSISPRGHHPPPSHPSLWQSLMSL